MKTLNKIMLLILLAVVLASCEKETFSFGELSAPANAVLTATLQGANTANPNGDGTGKVNINVTADKAISYKVDFGDGNSQMVPGGVITYRYATPGVNQYTITATANGTGGIQTVVSKKVNVFVRFELPADIVTALVGNGSKVWITDKAADGHFGVGPVTDFAPIWYSATPNSREACAYDDEITFSSDPAGNISIDVNNKGESFSIAAATPAYGVSGADGCYGINTGGKKQLRFSNSTSGSTTNVSRQISFEVGGNGLVNFGTGGKVYEILSITATQLHLRTIGSDGNAWYVKLKAK